MAKVLKDRLTHCQGDKTEFDVSNEDPLLEISGGLIADEVLSSKRRIPVYRLGSR